MSQQNTNEILFFSENNYLELSPIIAMGIFNSTKKFRETNQNPKNFDVVVELENEEILIAFIAKRAPGEKKKLGGRTSLGYGITYSISKMDGSIIKEIGQK